MQSFFARPALAALALAAAGSALAHDALFEPATPAAPGRYIVRYADEGKPLPYPPAKLTKVWGYDAAGKTLALQASPETDVVRVQAPREATLLALEFDNGFYSRTTSGTVNKPMNEAPGAVSALWAKKTGKYVVQWTPQVAQPLGMQFEIVPLAAAAPKAGDTLTVQVLFEGKPVEGIKVSKSEHGSGEKTDAQGRASYRVDAGRNFIWAERRAPVRGDPRHDSLATASNVVFQAN